jgi:hypothetical protein
MIPSLSSDLACGLYVSRSDEIVDLLREVVTPV